MAEDATGADLQRAEQRAGAVADVLELATEAAVDYRGASGEAPEQRLHRFLVDAEHNRSRRRLQIQLANAPDLRAKLGVGTVQPLPDAVRAHPASVQRALNGTAADEDAATSQQRVRQ